MGFKPSGSSGVGLERSCVSLPRKAGRGDAPRSDWMRQTETGAGVELLEAWFHGPAYNKHRHDTYGICVTDRGVQAFTYRGAVHIATPGETVVLHPDELHDGYAGSSSGFGYRLIYVEPRLIFAAVRALAGRERPLPFVRNPVVSDPRLGSAVRAAYASDHDELALDDLIARLAEGLLAAEAPGTELALPGRLDLRAIERARAFLDGATDRVVRSWELEAVTGLTRYDLARQFRAVVGTSPYRYSRLRRLDAARAQIALGRSLADVSIEMGFADQAHLTRAFIAAFGVTPARYGMLRRDGGGRP